MSAPSDTSHIVASYDDELRKLDARVQQMGGLAIAQTRDTIEIICGRDMSLVDRVLAREEEMNRLEHEVNEQVVRLLALRQPVADDLRTVVTALKVSSQLERVGDYAVSAARRGLSLEEGAAIPVKSPVSRMGDLVITLLDDALNAFQNRDKDLAIQIRDQDSEVDALHSSLFRELLTYMLEDPRSITACSQLMFVSKNLERVGDQATNIAEAAYYRATGKILTGDRPKDDTSSSAMASLSDAAERDPR